MAALISFFGIHAAVALLTWWRSRRRDGGDFFLGRRSLGAPVVAMSLLLTNLSTEQLVGLNGDGYRHGAVAIAWEVFGAFGLVLFALVFLPRYWAAGVTTIPEFIEQRCGAPTRRLMTVLMLLSLVGIGLPFVIYSGALALVGIFLFRILLNQLLITCKNKTSLNLNCKLVLPLHPRQLCLLRSAN